MFMKKDNLLLMDQLENIVEKDPIPSESEFNLRGVVPELVKSKSLRQPKEFKESKWEQQKSRPSIEMQIRMLLTFRAKHETFSTPPSQRAWSLMNSGGENAGLFPADSSDDEINVVEQSQEQNLSDSSSCLTPTQSGGDGQDSSTGGLSPICDDDRENVDRGKIRSSRPHGEEYGFGFASGRFRHMSQFGGNMSTTLSGSRERSEFRARSKEKGKGTKMHTYEGSSSRRRSTSSMPMPYQPQMYPPPSSNYMSTRGH
ncbi:hypothetical protein V6N13_063908 [Hibiscus sabdariffa]